MKKLILTLVTVFSLVACKKNAENSESNFEDAAAKVSANISEMNADSTSISVENLPKLSRKQTDSAIQAIKKGAIVEIEELKDEKKLLTEKVAKEMDSATRTTIISEIKITQQKIDSAKNKIAATTGKRTIAPKIIKETKVIYREAPTPKLVVREPKIVKKGELEISVEDLSVAQNTTKEQIFKYDGKVNSEQISSYDGKEYSYLNITIPFDKSDYFVDDLENNVGAIIFRNIEIKGQELGKNALCNLDITLVNDSKNASSIATPTSFGGRTLGAVGSGWNVIQEIFLFILPFWPVFLIGGIIYYFVRKRKTEKI